MKKTIKLGVLKGLLFYTIGFFISWAIYLIFGWGYKHAPGLHHIVGFLFILAGACFAFYYSILLLTGLKAKVNIGTYAVYLVATLAFVVFLIIIANSE